MKGKLISEDAQRTFAVILNTDDEAAACLTAFAKEHRLSASQFTGLGAFRDCVLGCFDWQKKDYTRIPIEEQVEVLALVGDIAPNDGEPKLHTHAVVSQADGTAQAGHLLEAHVRPTLEVIITESPTHLHRRSDPETGLALIRLWEHADGGFDRLSMLGGRHRHGQGGRLWRPLIQHTYDRSWPNSPEPNIVPGNLDVRGAPPRRSVEST